jgi:hypothetical protein
MLPFLYDKEGSGNTQEITELRKQLKKGIYYQEI